MLKHPKYLYIKRLLDIFFAILGILICLPLLYWWVLLINIFVTKGHPFFVQQRLGKNKKIFNIIKFRTIKKGVDPYLPPYKMTGEEQYQIETSFGHFLRKTQLDETLQLFNILIGDMSFVGPRPGCSVNEEELTTARDSYDPSVFSIRPGLTGLSQIILKDRHNPTLKAKTDYEYLLNVSFVGDTKIMFLTIFRMFVRRR